MVFPAIVSVLLAAGMWLLFGLFRAELSLLHLSARPEEMWFHDQATDEWENEGETVGRQRSGTRRTTWMPPHAKLPGSTSGRLSWRSNH
jgi:hypothetical protein